MAQLGRHAVAADDPVELMRRAVQVVGEVLGNDFCEVLELLPGGDSLRMVAGAGWAAEPVDHVTIPASAGTVAGSALAAAAPVVVDDFGTETRFGAHPSLLSHGAVSGLVAAIPGRDRPFGVLGTYSRRKRPFTAQDGFFLQSVANVLALFLQRHRAEEDRRRSESEHRRVFDSPLIGIAFWASEGAITEANDEFLRIIGYTRGDLDAGRVRWVDLTPPEHLHLDYGGLDEIRQTGRSTPYEKEYTRKDGGRVPILIGGSGFPGERDRGVCFALDMTRTQRAERELIRLAERDQVLLANSWDVISVIAPDGAMTYQSPSIERVLGYDEQELLGRKVLDYIHPDDVRLATLWIERVKSTPGTLPPFELRFRHKNGEWRWCECLGTNLLDHPAVRGLLFNNRDVTDRKRAEEELRRSERRYRTLVTATSMAVWTAAPTGEVIPTEEQNAFSGMRRAAAEGWGWLDALHPEDRERAERDWRAAVTSGQPIARECRIRRADGAWRQVAVRIVPVRDAGGRIEEWVGVGEDVTELRQAGEEVRRSERRYRSLVSALYQIVYVANSRGEVVESAGYQTVLGPDAPLTADNWVACMHPDDRDRVMADWTSALDSGRPVEIGYRVRGHDGGWREVIGRGIPVRDDEGAVEEWVGVIDDVTDRRRAEEDLRQSERRYRTLVAATPQIIWTMAPTGEPGLVLGAENYFGPGAPLGHAETWYDRIHPEDLDRVRTSIATALQAERPLAVEYRLRQANEKWRQMSARGMPVRDESGWIEEWVGITTDVTETRQLEEQLRQAQKMEAVGQLAGGVAHDFNNLLTIINGYSDMLLTSLPPADPTRELLAEIAKAGERAEKLTRQLLLFSRRQVVAPKVLNLNAVVSDAERMLGRLIGEDVRFATAFAPDLWPVTADPGQIEQVLLNLCVNARDAMPTGGRVTFETRNVVLDEGYARTHPGVAPGDYALLAVSDTGTGMDEATKAHMFEPFFTTKGPGKGTGLGLAVVFGVVKQSGGHIDVYSEIGRGTVFKLYFPRGRNRVAAKSALGLRLMPPGTETVLLAEDDEAVRALAQRVLKGCGYTVLEARDGREAVRVVEGHDGPLDLLISDVVMPHLGGRQLAEKVVALRPELRVLFLSGYTDDAVVRHGVREAEYAFLQKPFTPSVLAIKVREALDARG